MSRIYLPAAALSLFRPLNLLLILLGSAGGLLTVLILVFAFNDFFPGWPAHEVYQRKPRNTAIDVVYRPSDGDIFRLYPGRYRPPMNEWQSEFQLRLDRDGFREPSLREEHYPVAVFGDSFSEAPETPRPWPDFVAQELGIPVRNYAHRGYGPHEVARAIREFAKSERRNLIIYGFFAGNDILQTLPAPPARLGFF